jgi:hypothetical protein
VKPNLPIDNTAPISGGCLPFNQFINGKGNVMIKQFDALVEAGWYVIDTEFDETALKFWKEKAYDFLNTFVGPDHADTMVFRESLNSRMQAHDTELC